MTERPCIVELITDHMNRRACKCACYIKRTATIVSARLWIHARARLVEEHDARLTDQRDTERQLALVAAA
mgnify:CR=1 FL=1